jgi:hypothetical protein
MSRSRRRRNEGGRNPRWETMSHLRTVLNTSHLPRPNSIPKLQILHALAISSLHHVAKELLANEVGGFAPRDGVNRFAFFQTADGGGRGISVEPLHMTVHELSLRRCCCKQIRASCRWPALPDGIGKEQDAGLMVQLRSRREAGATERHTQLPHSDLR